ncbi:leukotriene A-4 hydrolase isoform X1 [Numida meleagris]|uniref:leukotriene A-4 hydrolase isoform X1 n=1 Tax=Numida meleagris TaxID=8996 RepID=UPI000B3E29E5|nr:leukotriene A-4 hydrolase isoform X1 [Numida meleagris]
MHHGNRSSPPALPKPFPPSAEPRFPEPRAALPLPSVGGALTAAWLATAARGAERVRAMAASDPSSFASPSCCLTRHLHLRCRVDFGAHALRGTAAFTVRAERDALRCLVLDTKDLQVFKVTVNGQDAKFAFGEKHSFKGTPLEITLPFEMRRGQEAIIEISFESSPKSSALQWFTPEQTSGKKHPFLFSQCQANHCRAILPCQDTPAVKLTYYAEVSVPKELVALMSASRDGEMPDPEDSSRKIYRFSQNVPIPSYLIALVVGDLESRKIGPRTLVWAEKELVDKSAYEFAETEAMLQTAEDLAGPYVWGQYDLLVLPPSFPYGGMENPCLTFVTPTLLAGDRSLSNVIAHEISHSWTGNLVTNKTWEHFWLNEGHTVYLERRIGGRLFGEQFRHFKALGGWRELQNVVNNIGDKNPITNLVPNLNEVDPDVAYSSVPYEKGFALLFYLEQLLGGPDVFMGFLKAYIQQFAYKSIVTEDWKTFLYSYFKDKVDVLDKVDWNSWLHAPGMPPVKPTYDMTLTNACVALSQRWIKAKESDLGSFSSADLKGISSHQLIEFLALLLLEAPLPLSHVKRMQQVYDFNAVSNSEIRFRWLRLCIQSKWEEAIPLALKMATEQGRMKFTRPLFRDLYNFDKSRDLAVKTFLEHRACMHPVTSMLVGKDLKQDE